jgi:hypothetical protein
MSCRRKTEGSSEILEEEIAETSRPHFSQLNIVSGDPEASVRFYRKLGVDISDGTIWRTQSGIHHVTAQSRSATAGAGPRTEDRRRRQPRFAAPG